MKQEIPQIGTKEFNDLASAYFAGKPKQETLEEFKKRFANDESNKNIGLNYQDGIYYGIEVGAKWQQEQFGKSEFIQKLRATLSDAEARRLIFETFKNE